MIFLENEKTIKTDISSEIREFSIKTTNKAFKILSDGLYSDKEGSIVRELSCNARDAHVEADVLEKPFYIHLPTELEPEFFTRDFGPGLSEEDIFGLYTTYFASSKVSSNDYVGAFGLGSKSPFAYTDSFTVTSYFGGMIKTFQCVIQHGSPHILKLLEEKSSGETGLKVSFSVKEDDFSLFKKKVQQKLRPFKVKPKIKIECDIDDIQENFSADPILVTDNFVLKTACYTNMFTLVQGCVEYQVSVDTFLSKFRSIAGVRSVIFREIKNFFNSFSILVYLPIGSFDTSVSRESISLDSNSIKQIVKHIYKIVKSIDKIFENNIDSLKNDSERALYYTKNLKALKRYNSGLLDRLANSFDDLDQFFTGDIKDFGYSRIIEKYNKTHFEKNLLYVQTFNFIRSRLVNTAMNISYVNLFQRLLSVEDNRSNIDLYVIPNKKKSFKVLSESMKSRNHFKNMGSRENLLVIMERRFFDKHFDDDSFDKERINVIKDFDKVQNDLNGLKKSTSNRSIKAAPEPERYQIFWYDRDSEKPVKVEKLGVTEALKFLQSVHCKRVINDSYLLRCLQDLIKFSRSSENKLISKEFFEVLDDFPKNLVFLSVHDSELKLKRSLKITEVYDKLDIFMKPSGLFKNFKYHRVLHRFYSEFHLQIIGTDLRDLIEKYHDIRYYNFYNNSHLLSMFLNLRNLDSDRSSSVPTEIFNRYPLIFEPGVLNHYSNSSSFKNQVKDVIYKLEGRS